MNNSEYTQQPPSKRELKETYIDGNRQHCSPDMLYCAAYMILEMDHPRDVLSIGLEYLTSTLEACRADGSFLAATDRLYTPLSIYANTRFNPPGFGQPALSNQTHIFQRAWHQSAAVVCDDVATSDLLNDSREAFTTAQCQSMIMQRLSFNGQAVGMTCIDYTRDTHRWNDDEVQFVQNFNQRLLGPLAGLSRYWARSQPHAVTSKPSEAELAVIRLAAAGHSYKTIAAKLHKSVRTVENQLRNARLRLQAANLSELVNKCGYWL